MIRLTRSLSKTVSCTRLKIRSCISRRRKSATYDSVSFDLGYFGDESALDANFYVVGRYYYNFTKHTPARRGVYRRQFGSETLGRRRRSESCCEHHSRCRLTSAMTRKRLRTSRLSAMSTTTRRSERIVGRRLSSQAPGTVIAKQRLRQGERR